MKLSFNIAEHDSAHTHVSQNVNFFYAFSGREATNSLPQKQNYLSLFDSDENDILAVFNYVEQDNLKSPTGESSVGTKAFSNITIYKREIWNEDGVEETETTYHPVAVNSSSLEIVDYNVANKRNYEYIAYPSASGEIVAIYRYVSVNWGYWSLTELHPVNNSRTQFTAEPSDVWLFKYNVEPGGQTQNISKTQVDNLTAYPSFVHGPKNTLSGQVTALMGSEMISFSLASTKYVLNTDSNGRVVPGQEMWSPIMATHTGGYTERLKFSPRLTSNEKIDMLNAWRDVAYSGNPKLLKDMKGQAFLVQITDPSNTPNETWNKMPDSISFSWTQVGTLDGVTITNPEAIQ